MYVKLQEKMEAYYKNWLVYTVGFVDGIVLCCKYSAVHISSIATGWIYNLEMGGKL